MEPRRRTGAVLTVIRTVGETGSTNADMLALAATGLEEGVWLRAERQRLGRGRQGRSWSSPPGNFAGSTIVRLRAADPPPATLAMVAAVAVAAVASAALGPSPAAMPMLKWPNDLLIGGAKVAGILLERSGAAVVIGIGVNLAHHPALPDRATTSLGAWGATIAPAAFAESLAAAFARWVARWRCEGPGVVRAAWLAAAHPPGTALTVHLPDGEVAAGRFDGLAPDLALRLRLADGAVRVIHAGDVMLAEGAD